MLQLQQQPNNIYKVLHSGFGLKNASVAVIENDNSTTILSGSKCWHANVGASRLVKVKRFQNQGFGRVEFSCEVRKVLAYSKTDKRMQQSDRILEKKKQKKIFHFFQY